MTRLPHAIPEAWPALMTQAQAAAYCSVSASTFRKICPVAPLDLGANVLRWPRTRIDAWIADVPVRLTAAILAASDVQEPSDADEWAEARRRAQRRIGRRR